ncbi:alginate lyase family protein [Pedobacter frigidisoli]|uniref:alginate lyase family protein n=1 Tax=Pedobacter frigidisoli TaxID=2530455 RepID=UPI002930975C|nr:alginate lyase family protein [Pedobacter frigidisoli]
MRIFALICLFTGINFAAYSQTVSLNAKEIKKLKAWIKQDAAAKNTYAKFEQAGAKYLNEAPNPLDTIRTEGLLKGNPKKIKTWLAFQDMDKMYTLALLYRLTGDQKYLDKSTSFLLAWAKINRPNGNPIDDTNVDKAVEAYDLVKDNLAVKDREVITKWLAETAWAEVNSVRMKPGRATAINNWNAHRLKVVGEIAYAIDNRELIQWTIDNLKSHIDINLYADGTSLDFKERDAMHYHIYDLQPMLKLAIIIDRAKGSNFYSYESPKGASIRKSVEWLLPYMEGKKQHEEYVNTTVQFDRDRAKNNEPGFAAGTMFEPKMALPVVELSVYFDGSQKKLLQELKEVESMQSLTDEIQREKIR